MMHAGNEPAKYELSYIHRGAPEDRMTINGSMISSLKKGSFILKDRGTQIPFHRVLYVIGPDKSVLWRKRERKSKPED